MNAYSPYFYYPLIQLNLAPSEKGQYISDLKYLEQPLLASMEQVKNLQQMIKADLPAEWQNRNVFIILDYEQNKMFMQCGKDVKILTKNSETIHQMFNTCLFQAPFDTRKRLAKLQSKADEIWYELLSVIGRKRIEEWLGHSALLPPSIEITSTGFAEAIHRTYSVDISNIWLLEQRDLPFNWHKMSFSEKAFFFNSYSQPVLSEEQVMLFSYLITHTNWDNIRFGMIAHELAHFCQSWPVFTPGQVDYRVYREKELEADICVGMLKDKSIGNGALLFMQANLAILGEIPIEITHPTYATRIWTIQREMAQH